MPSRPLEELNAIREGISEAIKKGCESPREVYEYIESVSTLKPPTITTIGKIMREMGYEPAGAKWEKKGK